MRAPPRPTLARTRHVPSVNEARPQHTRAGADGVPHSSPVKRNIASCLAFKQIDKHTDLPQSTSTAALSARLFISPPLQPNYLSELPLFNRRTCLSQHDRPIFSDAPGGCPPQCDRPDIACRPNRLRQGTMAREQSRVLTRRAGHRRRTRKVQCRLEREMHGSCLLKDTSTRSHVTRPARGLYRSC